MRPIEEGMLVKLGDLGSDLSRKLGRAYEEARERIFSDIVDGVIRAEPNFTDHGEPHIKDVLDKAWNVLGDNLGSLGAIDAYILCTSVLFHDAGNYFGRDNHNENINKIYNYVRTGDMSRYPSEWSDEYQVVSAIVKAHSGLSVEGTTDTLVDVGEDGYCHGKEVHLRDIAAIVRFSDELAQGRCRTSSFRLQNDKNLPPESELHHRYEHSVKATVDRGNGRIVLHYAMQMSLSDDVLKVQDSDLSFGEFFSFVLYRLNKLNAERKYGAYYSQYISSFKKLQCDFKFIHNGRILRTPFDNLELTDLVHPDGARISRLEEDNSQYEVWNVVNVLNGIINGA